MDHTFLNASNISSSFTNDLQSAEELYFTNKPEEVFTSDNDSDENELANSDSEEPENDIELEPEIEWRECDINDRQKVESFLEKGCGCLYDSDGENCSKRYMLEKVPDHRQICFELASSELDMVILTQLQACSRQDDVSYSSRQSTKRKRTRTCFTFQGKCNHSFCCNEYNYVTCNREVHI